MNPDHLDAENHEASPATTEAAERERRGPSPLSGGLGFVRLRVLSIHAGGAAGALTRAALAGALPQREGSWPWATFLVNVAGALILGWLLTRLAERVAPTRHWRLLLGTGFCGALTTFSTFQIEAIRLATSGYPGTAAAYVVVSIGAGMVAAAVGVIAARRERYS